MIINRPCKLECKICEGTGSYAIPTDEVNPLTGEPVTRFAPCPEMMKAKLLEKSGLLDPDMHWGSILDDGNAYEAMEAIKSVLEVGYGWVYLWGGSGNAKSDMLMIAVAEWVRDNKPGAYANMADIISDLRMAFDTDHPSMESQRKIDRWKDAALLSIDEFEKVSETDWVKEKIFTLMDHRYRTAVGKKSITLMASNINPSTFESYLLSRIEDGRFKVIKMTAESLRPGLEY